LIEFWDPAKPNTRKAYIGYGGGTDVASYYININPEGGKVHINGGGLAMQDGAGIQAQPGASYGLPANTPGGSLNTNFVGSGSAHAHPIDLRVQYVDVIIASKN